MKKVIIMSLLVMSTLLSAHAAERNITIVPLPESVTLAKGSFKLDDKSAIVVEGAGLDRVAEMLADDLLTIGGERVAVVKGSAKRAIRLVLTPGKYADEEYRVEVTPKEIVIEGSTPQGVFYGTITLRQMVQDGEIPCSVIEDKPTFEYRGAMLDVVRHFFPKEDVKEFIDILALHKINHFHWHLTDDQGWRIEIKRYPLLAEVGSKRPSSQVGRFDKSNPDIKYDNTPVEGFYTQEDIREIVAYAAERYIEVVPEIEMPGHAIAALTPYPYLGCNEGPFAVWGRWGVSEDVFCAGKESTFEFLENVLAEVIDLFPSKMIHIGGDECPKSRWKMCELCQKRIADEGLKNEHALQSYFMHRITDWLESHGRSAVCWDEVIDGGIGGNVTVMAWRDQKYGIQAARDGNRVIMTPKWNCYFDYSQTSDPEKYEPLCVLRYVPLRQAYRLDPYDQLLPAHQKNIYGVQANTWVEYMPNMEHVERMILPRLAAIAEVGWSYDRKEYNGFVERMGSMRKLYDRFDYQYSTFVFDGIE